MTIPLPQRRSRTVQQWQESFSAVFMHEAQLRYREALRRIGRRWKALPARQRISEQVAEIRQEELIRALLDHRAAERERCTQIVDDYRVAHAQKPDLVAALSEITERIRLL